MLPNHPHPCTYGYYTHPTAHFGSKRSAQAPVSSINLILLQIHTFRSKMTPQISQLTQGSCRVVLGELRLDITSLLLEV